MKFYVKRDSKNDIVCPHCLEKGKATYIAMLVYKDKILWAYRCTNCRKIIFGEEKRGV